MKWWGWGVEGVGFHHEDKPSFRDFVIKAIGVDPDSPAGKQMSLDDLTVPAPIISDELLAELVEAVGDDNVVRDDPDRIVHTYGKSVRDLMRLRANDIPRVPDAIVYPADEAEVQLVVDRAVAANAVLIPFGGGSNISGSLQAPADETRTVISLDLGRMNKVIDIDEESGLARIQAGALGPDIEEQLETAGLDPRTLPGQLHPQHPRRLGRHPLLGHAVRQVRRHRPDHPRPAGRAARQGAGRPRRCPAPPPARASAR